MNILEALNWMGIVGTALLMMAVCTIWYSNVLFGTLWARTLSLSPEALQQPKQKLVQSLILTFFCYVILFAILDYAQIILSPILSVSPLMIGTVIALCVGAFTAVPVIWEQKSFLYYVIHFGFALVFIFGGTFVLQYWPW